MFQFIKDWKLGRQLRIDSKLEKEARTPAFDGFILGAPEPSRSALEFGLSSIPREDVHPALDALENTRRERVDCVVTPPVSGVSIRR
jgi:hypothetical protein